GSGSAWVRDPIDPTCNNIATCQNHIPANRIDQNALNLLKQFPLPTNGLLASNFAVNPVTQDSNHQGDVRVDQYLSQNDSMFVRFSKARSATLVPAPYGGVIDGSQFGGGDQTVNVNTLAASWTHILSSTTVAEARFGWYS